MDETTQVSQLVARIDAQLAELENERQVVLRVLAIERPDYESTRNRISDMYSTALKKLAKGDTNAAHRELAEVDEKLEDARATLLKESIERSAGSIERTITSPLWLGERGNYLQVTDRIQRDTRELAARDRSAALPQLVGHLNELAALQRQLAVDERRVRSRLPIQVLLWGLPIVIGFWASDKFTNRQNFAFLAVLVVLAAMVYGVLRFRVLSKLAPVRGFRHWLGASPRGALVVIQIPVMLFAIAFSSAPAIDDFVILRRVVFNVGPVPASVGRGTEVRIPYELLYNHDSVVTGVKVSIHVPGLTDCFREHNAVAQARAARGECLVLVPQDAAPGKYGVEVNVFFTAPRWLPLPGADRFRLRSIKRVFTLTVV